MLLVLSRNCLPYERLIITGDCVYAAGNATTIMAVPNNNTERLLLISHPTGPADTGKVSGILQMRPVGFYFRERLRITNSHFRYVANIDSAASGIGIDFCGAESGIHITGLNLCSFFIQNLYKVHLNIRFGKGY